MFGIEAFPQPEAEEEISSEEGAPESEEENERPQELPEASLGERLRGNSQEASESSFSEEERQAEEDRLVKLYEDKLRQRQEEALASGDEQHEGGEIHEQLEGEEVLVPDGEGREQRFTEEEKGSLSENEVKEEVPAEETPQMEEGAVTSAAVEQSAEQLKPKTWEEMTQEERLEKYGKTFEIREKLHQFKKVRTELATLERNLSIKDKEAIDRIKQLSFDSEDEMEKRSGLSERAQEYLKTLDTYENARAEYVGAKTWRMLKENKRRAESSAEAYQEGNFEKLRKGWNFIGKTMSLDTFLNNKGVESKSRLRGMARKFVNLRTGISGALLAGTMLVPGIGAAAFAARRGMAGVGAGMMSYEFMKARSGAKLEEARKVDPESLKDMSIEDIESKMYQYEELARFNGTEATKEDGYEILRREYYERSKNAENIDLAKKMQAFDEHIRKGELTLSKEERRRKVKAGFIGAVASVSPTLVRALGLNDEVVQAKEALQTTGSQIKETAELAGNEIKKQFESALGGGGLTIEEYGRALRAPLMTSEQLGEFESAQEDISDEVAAAVEQPKAENILEIDTTQETIETETVDSVANTIEKGGSAWNAAEGLVEKGLITKEEFSEAWSSPASTVELPSGESVHISELGLTHEGDQVMYVPETENTPAHFTVVDYAKDKLHFGSNEDLVKGLQEKGVKPPEWLDKAAEVERAEVQQIEGVSQGVGGGEMPPDAKEVEGLPWLEEDGAKDVTDAPQEAPSADLPEGAKEVEGLPWLENQESLPETKGGVESTEKNPFKDSLEVSKLEGDFAWGGAEFAHDTNGNIVDVRFNETLSPAERSTLVEQATKQYLREDYIEILENDLEHPDLVAHRVMPNKIAQAKEAAFELFKLQHAYDALPNKHSAEGYFIKEKILQLTEVRQIPYSSINDRVVFRGLFMNPDIFKSVNLQ